MFDKDKIHVSHLKIIQDINANETRVKKQNCIKCIYKLWAHVHMTIYKLTICQKNEVHVCYKMDFLQYVPILC